MTYKELKAILLNYYTLNSTKHILKDKNPERPSFKNALIMREKHGIPLEAWLDIKGFLAKQKEQES